MRPGCEQLRTEHTKAGADGPGSAGLLSFNQKMTQEEITSGNINGIGGGTDITPAYLDTDDMKHFHGTYKEIRDKHDPEFYPKCSPPNDTP